MAELATLPANVPMPEKHAAFPGALLAVAGLFLIVWALRDWGVLDSSPDETTVPA